jgi:hypothetical protein
MVSVSLGIVISMGIGKVLLRGKFEWESLVGERG